MKTELIDIDLIRIDGDTQARCLINLDVVDEYAGLYRDEVPGVPGLPPLVVFFDGAEYWLGDGYHRRHAGKKAGLAKLECEVRPGTKRDAVLYAAGANQAHGLRRSTADKRKAVGMLLADAEWAAKSDRWIGETAGVSNHLVADVRAATGNSPSSSKRTGKDGKTRAVAAVPNAVTGNAKSNSCRRKTEAPVNCRIIDVRKKVQSLSGSPNHAELCSEWINAAAHIVMEYQERATKKAFDESRQRAWLGTARRATQFLCECLDHYESSLSSDDDSAAQPATAGESDAVLSETLVKGGVA